MRGFRRLGVFAVLAAAGIGLAGAAWWHWSHRTEVAVAPAPASPSPQTEAIGVAMALLQNAVATQKASNDRISAAAADAKLLLQGDVCDPKRQAEIETLLEKLEFAALLETSPASVQTAATFAREPASAGDTHTLRNDELVKQLRAQTVFILAPAGGDEIMLGSGMVIAPGLVLTNRHVVAQSVGRDLVVMSASQPSPLLGHVKVLSADATATGSDISDDFALVTVDGSLTAPPLQLAGGAAPLDRVVAAGFPTNVITADRQFQDLKSGHSVGMPEVVLSRGDVRVIENPGGPTPVVAHTAEISEGNSGGPLVNECGQLVGINTFGIQIPGENRAAGFAIGDSAINRFLQRQNAALATGDACIPAAQ